MWLGVMLNFVCTLALSRMYISLFSFVCSYRSKRFDILFCLNSTQRRWNVPSKCAVLSAFLELTLLVSDITIHCTTVYKNVHHQIDFVWYGFERSAILCGTGVKIRHPKENTFWLILMLLVVMVEADHNSITPPLNSVGF